MPEVMFRISIVKVDAETLVPAAKAPTIKFALLAPQEQSIKTPTGGDVSGVPTEVVILAHVGVIAAVAVPFVITLAVNKPDAGEPNAVAFIVKITPKVFPEIAVAAVAGCTPS